MTDTIDLNPAPPAPTTWEKAAMIAMVDFASVLHMGVAMGLADDYVDDPMHAVAQLKEAVKGLTVELNGGTAEFITFTTQDLDKGDRIEAIYATIGTIALADGLVSRVLDPHEHSGPNLVRFLAGKQRDYGPQNILSHGHLGIAVRLNDKVARLENLLANRDGEASNESLADTYVDIIGYATVGLMLQRGHFELPLKADLGGDAR